MKLLDCLNYAAIDTLRSIADYYEFNCTKHSKMALHQTIASHFHQPGFLAEQVVRWAEGRKCIWLRLYGEADRPFSQRELQGWFADDNDISRAQQEGWLFRTSRLAYSEPQFVIPVELRKVILDFSTEQFRTQLVSTDVNPLVFSDEQDLLVTDVDVFLEYVRNHFVEITVDGALYKRHLTKLLQLMRVPEEPLTGGWRFGYGRRFHEYPDRFALLYDFAFHQGYIVEEDTNLRTVPEKERDWLEAAQGMRTKWIFQFYVASYRRAILRLPTVLRLISLAPEGWTTEQSMYKAAAHFINKYYYDSVAEVWDLRVLQMLQHLGLLRRGTDESGTRWFQTTNIGQQLLSTGEILANSNPTVQQVLIIQPNFRILVTAHRPMITTELSQITKLQETGAMQVYQLSQESFTKGLNKERPGAYWLEFLRSHAQNTIPGNVEKTLLGWEQIWLQAQSPMTS